MLFPRTIQRGEPALPDDPRSILLVRLTARGDVLLATPVIAALRRRYPNARISWAVESHAQDFIIHHPELDDVIVWDRAEWKTLLRARRFGAVLRRARDLRAKLRAHRFDLAIDLHGLLRSGWVAWLSGAPVRIGLGSRELSWLLMTATVPKLSNFPGSPSLEYLHLTDRLGLATTDVPMSLHLSEEDEAFVRQKVDELNLAQGYGVACPFTTRPHKHWYEDRWARLADRIAEEIGLPMLLVGGPGDRPAAKRILDQSHSPWVDLVGRCSLSQSAALVKHASLFIGVDTGLTHAAATFHTPCVMLYGSHMPYAEAPNPQARIVLHMPPCAPCVGNVTCGGIHHCMRAITVDEVVEEARALLAGSSV